MGSLLVLAGPPARADLTWTVSLDTSQLATNYTGPFALDFELVGSNGNTVTLSNFSFGGGGAGLGPRVPHGGRERGSRQQRRVNDSANFFSDFNQQFTPGRTLTFTVDSTLVPPASGGFPDNFSMVIFSGYDTSNGYNPYAGTGGTPIPTSDPTGADTFLNLNVNGPGSTTMASFPSTSGDVAVTVTPTSVVPEPSTAGVTLFALAVVGLWRCCRLRSDCRAPRGQPSP